MQRAAESREPNWSKWRLIPDARLWEIVALSLAIAPERVDHHPQSWMHNQKLFRESQEFQDRLDVVRANLWRVESLKPTFYVPDEVANSKVSLVGFAQFCKAAGWSLPEEFPRDLRGEWGGQDLWTIREFAALLCGFPPDPGRPDTPESNAATDAIKRAVTASALVAVPNPRATVGDKMYGSDLYFLPAVAIAWGLKKRGQFPRFPFAAEDIEQATTPVTDYECGRIIFELQRVVRQKANSNDSCAGAYAQIDRLIADRISARPLAAKQLTALEEQGGGGHSNKKSEDGKQLSEPERQTLQRQIGVLALCVAEKGGKYRRGDKPNASQIASLARELAEAMPDASLKGLSVAHIREAIAEGMRRLVEG